MGVSSIITGHKSILNIIAIDRILDPTLQKILNDLDFDEKTQKLSNSTYIYYNYDNTQSPTSFDPTQFMDRYEYVDQINWNIYYFNSPLSTRLLELYQTGKNLVLVVCDGIDYIKRSLEVISSIIKRVQPFIIIINNQENYPCSKKIIFDFITESKLKIDLQKLFVFAPHLYNEVDILISLFKISSYYNQHHEEIIFNFNLETINQPQHINKGILTVDHGIGIFKYINDNLTRNSNIGIFVVGEKNAGKSTLVNLLLGEKRSITNYDDSFTIETLQLSHKDYPIIFFDTPGNLLEQEKVDLFSQIKYRSNEKNIENFAAILLIKNYYSGEKVKQLLQKMEGNDIQFILAFVITKQLPDQK